MTLKLNQTHEIKNGQIYKKLSLLFLISQETLS